MSNIVHVLIIACVSFQCEPLIITKSRYEYGGGYYDRSVEPPLTVDWCRNSFAAFQLRDFAMVSPSTKDIYYLDPALIGFRGVEYNPDTVECWPLNNGGPR